MSPFVDALRGRFATTHSADNVVVAASVAQVETNDLGKRSAAEGRMWKTVRDESITVEVGRTKRPAVDIERN